MIDNISWLAIYPEIVLLVMACVITLVDLGVKSPRRTATYVLTMLTLAVVAGHRRRCMPCSGNTFYGFEQHGGQRCHGQLAQVLCHGRHDGDLGLCPPLLCRARHAARRRAVHAVHAFACWACSS